MSGGGGSPMSTPSSRPRTRNQWDQHYRNLINERKRNEGGYVDRDVVRKSLVEHYFVIEEDTGHAASSGRKREKRTRNETPEQGSESIEKVMNVNEVSPGRVLGGKMKLDVRPKSDSVDEIEFLCEKIVSSGSGPKMEPESGSGSGSKVGCDSNKGVIREDDDEGNSLPPGSRIRPGNKHLDVSAYSVDSTKSSDKIVVDLCTSEDESTSYDDDDGGGGDDDDDELSSDEDYRVEEIMNSESSEEEEKTSDATLRPRGKSRIVKEEGNTEREKGDDDNGSSFCKRSFNQQKQEEEIQVEPLDIDDNCCYKASADWGQCDEYVKYSSIRKSTRISRKGDGELVGLTGNSEPCSKYGYKDTGRKESGLKKRKVSGVDIPVDSEKTNDEDEAILARFLRLGTSSKKSEENEPGLGKFRFQFERGQQFSGTKMSRADRNECLSMMLIQDMNSINRQLYSHIKEENPCEQYTLPLKFRFEDEVDPPPPEKSEWEKHIDSLFRDLQLGLYGSEIDGSDSSAMKNDEDSIETQKSPAACEHDPILDEQIGIVCNYCSAVILDIKYVLPHFYTRPSRRQDWKHFFETSSFIPDDQTKFQDSSFEAPNPDTSPRSKGTVWDLVNGIEQEMYPHQCEGFEFMWKNIGGHTLLEKLKRNLPEGGNGCIISHAPGTGKTRLTIVFLMSFLKLYPACRPIIIAPRGMLLTWESEFKKWNINILFHNMNKTDLSEYSNLAAAEIISKVGYGAISVECIRLLKLRFWMKSQSILGVSYKLFEMLAAKNGKGKLHHLIRDLLLECPSLLVLDEGHTPRNERSRIWKVLSELSTQRRIILSGTPFQNNFTELYNTLALVNPKMVNQMDDNPSYKSHGHKHRVARKMWMNMTSSIGKKTDDGLEKLKNMLDPFVHVHKGTILQEKLPGLRETLIFLQPTELQKELLETCSKLRKPFHRYRMVSLVSVHPSLMEKEKTRKSSSDLNTKLDEIKSNVNEGVKTRFVMKLIQLADAVGERVLIFSQYIAPLLFIKKQIMTHFYWKEERELLYMDGQLDERKRQLSISSFNDETSDAKVLLASEFACSEGISLVGASRVVLLDTVWNPSKEKQATSRAYRLGQKRFVYVYRLLTSGTEVRQYAQQIKKTRISELIFSPVDELSDKSKPVPEDKVLESMRGGERFGDIFEMVIHEPKESDIIEISGLAEH